MNYNYDEKFLENKYINAEDKIINIDLDFYQLIAMEKIVKHYTNTNTMWEYKLGKNSKHYFTIIVDKIDELKWGKLKNIENKFLKDILVHICYDVTNFKKIVIKAYISNKIYEKNCDYYLKKVSDEIYKEIVYIYNNVKKMTLSQNYFYEIHKLSKGYFTGFYDYGKIKIDCGKPINDFSKFRLIKTKIMYNRLILKDFKYPLPIIETLFFDRRIMISLIQLFWRCSFSEDMINGRYYSFEKNIYESSPELDNREIGNNVNELKCEHFNNSVNNFEELINIFYELSDELKDIFIVSSDLYVKAQNNIANNAITLYVIALENFGNKFYKQEKNKKDKIYKFLLDLFGFEIVTKEFIDYIYEIRCLYSHEGISNNRLKNSVFNITDFDRKLELYVEELVYVTLLKWLKSKKEDTNEKK